MKDTRGSSIQGRVRDALLGYGMLAPSLAVFAVFVFFPFIKNFWIGSTVPPLFPGATGPAGKSRYVGYEQWRTVLDLNHLYPALGIAALIGIVVAILFVAWQISSHRRRNWTLAPTALAAVAATVLIVGPIVFINRSNSAFATSLSTTLKFWLYTVPPTIILGTLLAVLGQRLVKGIGVYRTLFMMSLATGVGVAGVIFSTLFNPNVGFLGWLGINVKPQILLNTTWALPGIALFAVWANIGLAFIILSSGMQSIPDELYEAARVDGAGAFRRFFQVTVPMLSPTLLFVFVLGSVTALIQSFPYVDVTTGAQAANTNTQTLPTLIVQRLQNTVPKTGEAAVLSVALFVIALLLTVVQLLVFERRVYYGDEGA
jgi:sn-glycerol 3-phosphate transport system permease protein